MDEDNNNNEIEYDVNAKLDACLDLGVRRFVYSSAAGAFAGLLFFRSPVTRWASIAFGAGVGIGSAYSVPTSSNKRLWLLGSNTCKNNLVLLPFVLGSDGRRKERSPVTRWASIAFGAGVGIGSAYSDCSQKFDGSTQTSSNVVEALVDKD